MPLADADIYQLARPIPLRVDGSGGINWPMALFTKRKLITAGQACIYVP